MTDKHPRYSTVAIGMHWAIAVLILLNLATGFVMEGLRPPVKAVVVPFHISCGITVLALSVLRIVWRLTHRPPPLLAGLAPWERAAAHAAHTLLYFLMVVMPLLGWSIISAHPPRPQGAAAIWGFMRLPAIGPISHLDDSARKAAHAAFVDAHSIGGWILAALVIAHVAAALKHQWLDHHAELARMGIGRR